MNKLILFLAVCIVSSLFAQASTTVTGQIRTNTTWTKAGSPYVCTGKIEVAPDVTLTIEPGVTVILNDVFIVYGSLIMNTTIADSITFKATPKGSAKGYYIVLEESAFSDTTIKDYKLQYFNFRFVGISFRKNAPSLEVSDCRFEGNYASIGWNARTGASLLVHDNYLSGGVYAGDYGVQLSAMKVYNNNFDHAWSSFTILMRALCDTTYIYNNIFHDGGEAIKIEIEATVVITGNIFSHNQLGVNCVNNNVMFYIEDNIFTGNKQAMRFWFNGPKSAIVKHNSIYNNDYGILVNRDYGNPVGEMYNITLDSNCIYNNKISGLYWSATNNYSLGANWWGSADTSIIDTNIDDFKDDFHKGLVSYQPFLANNPGCKTYAPTGGISKLMSGTEEQQVVVYPNPFGHQLTITVSKYARLKEVALYNITGVQVASTSGMQGSVATIDTKHLPAGMYIYRAIYADHTSTSGKVFKQ